MVSDGLIASHAPDFRLPAIKSLTAPAFTVSLADYAGEWLMLVFYPRDFSFVCPTELTSFNVRLDEFEQRNCRILGLSVDSIETHAEWLKASPADGGLGELDFPLAADVGGAVSQQYGVWSNREQISYRGTFLIDPDGIVQYSVIHNLAVGRSVDETLRVLDALQSGGLCPASWTRADGNLDLENALKPGRVLGQYRLVNVQGQGSFGHVFAAWDSRLERSVALKVFKRQTRESRDALLSEARAAAPLKHPNVCTIYAVDEIDGLLVISMELLEGQTLTEYPSTTAPLAELLSIAEGIASGLAAAHAQHIVHGDLKPDNILIGHDGIPRILDFGLAHKGRVAPPANGQTSATTTPPTPAPEALDQTVRMVVEQDQRIEVSGTPAYMAPERWSNQPIHPANDIYSFGIILVEMLTGRRVFPESDLAQLLRQIRDTTLAERLASNLPEALRPLCTKMLSIDFRQRPTAEEVLEQLKTIQSMKAPDA